MRFVILFSWLIIAALPVVVSNEGIPHALRSILMVPPVFIFAGFGGIWLYEWVKSVVMHQNVLQIRVLNIFVAIFLSLLILQSYHIYFIEWGKNPHVYGAFNAEYITIGRQINALPKELPKYVVVEATGVDVYGIPMPAQTVMYITDTFMPEKQKEKNIFYILPTKISQIPENSYVVSLK